MGNVGQALAYYHQALKIMERIGDKHGAAHQYFNLGRLYRKQGDVAQARAHFRKAKALYEMMGDTRWAQQAARALRGL